MKRLKWMLILLLGCALIAPQHAEAAETKTVAIFLDGEKLDFDVPPVIINGSTMVPMRAVFEAFGASLKWSNTTKTVTAIRDDLQLQYTLGRPYAMLNGQRVEFGSAPGRIIEGRTMVPLRFVGESLGSEVGYDAMTRTVTIQSDPHTNLPSILNRYRVTLPYQTILEDMPYLISFMTENSDADSYVFFGDSLTWGANLGRMEAHPYLVQQRLKTETYNLAVPGFSDTHLNKFIPYALQNQPQANVVIQLQYFWGETKSYTGFPELLLTQLPDYSTSLRYIKQDLNKDFDINEHAEIPYFLRDAEFRKERIGRGQTLFLPGTTPNSTYAKQLVELRDWMASRSEQSFYIYMPPYLLKEIYKYTAMTEANFTSWNEWISELFSGVPNVQYKDFNQLTNTWGSEHFIDWWHRTVAGEQQFAKVMADWLQAK